jgi:hypothetical protein
MSNETITYVVAAGCGALALAAYVGLVLVPAWTAYSRWYERIGAAFLSLYVLAALVGVGVAAGAGVVWFWGGI